MNPRVKSQIVRTHNQFAKLFCSRCRDLDLKFGGDVTKAIYGGIKYLTKIQYEDQTATSNLGWECPDCGCTTCRFDSKYFELLLELPTS